MTRKKKKRSVEVEIVSYTKDGYGLGYVTNEEGVFSPLEAPYTVVGDQIRGMVQRKRRGHFFAQEVEILSPSADRVKPRCIHVGTCGGCRWQQLSYKEQLKQKHAQICSYFDGCVKDLEVIQPVVVCDPPFHYRNKMEFSFSQDLAGNRYLGLMKAKSRGRVVNLTECHLVNPWMVETLEIARKWWEETELEAFHPPSGNGTLRTLTLREGLRTGDRMVYLTVSGNPEFALSQKLIDSFVAVIKEKVTSIFLHVHQAIKGQPTQIYEMHLFGEEWIREKISVNQKEFEFYISPKAFFQPNTRQAERVYQKAIDFADLNKESVVIDLYCGTGTLGICASPFIKEVIGIELSPEAIIDARMNAKENGISNITFYQGDVAEVLAKENLPKADVLFVDPPRVGLGSQAIEQVLSLNSNRIVYISCNPKTQAEDCKELIKHGYKIKEMRPIDQFPHTIHCENVILLTKELA